MDDVIDLATTEDVDSFVKDKPKASIEYRPSIEKHSGLSSIQVSIEFKERLKALKGSMSYEDYIKKLMNL